MRISSAVPHTDDIFAALARDANEEESYLYFPCLTSHLLLIELEALARVDLMNIDATLQKVRETLLLESRCIYSVDYLTAQASQIMRY